MRRLATVVLVVLGAAGFSAAVALPSQAGLWVRTLAGTGAAATTTTTGTTTTTASRQPTDSSTTHVVTAFPAAGGLSVKGVAARKAPSPHARVLKVMHFFRSDYRPQEIFAVGKKIGKDGQVWYRISVPMRPNGRYGWVPAADVDLKRTVSKIVVHVGARAIDIFRRGKRVWHAQVAVGAPGMETPRGHYYVTARFVPYKDPFLGVFAVETSAYSRLTEWPGGGVVGIHGTDMPWLLGKAVSHGCVRVANRTARALRRYAPLGTPILIEN